MGLFFLLLWMLTVSAPIPAEDEGIVVTFGDADEGGGMPDVSAMDEIIQNEQIPAPAPPARSSDNDLMVDEDEEFVDLAKQTNKKVETKTSEDIKRRNDQRDKARADSIAEAKARAERKAKEQEAIDNANQMAALFGNAGNTSGASGDTDSNVNTSKGNPVGNPIGKGYGSVNSATWNLPGRACKHLPEPSRNFKQEGKVVVRIWVDCMGNVTNAQVVDGDISDSTTKRLALEAARKAKFTEGETPQIGHITYVFTYTNQQNNN